MLLSEGQMSDHKGARLMLPALPAASALLGDRGYDSNWFRQALAGKGIKACIPSSKSRKVPIPHDKMLYRQRHKIEKCSAGSRTGGASPPATTAAPTPSSPPSASPPPWVLVVINES